MIEDKNRYFEALGIDSYLELTNVDFVLSAEMDDIHSSICLRRENEDLMSIGDCWYQQKRLQMLECYIRLENARQPCNIVAYSKRQLMLVDYRCPDLVD